MTPMHGRNHLPWGSDPIPGFPSGGGGPTLEELIEQYLPAGLWKLDELAGNTANDSSGNANHMTVPGGGYDTATWGQGAGPPGTTSALFTQGTGTDGTRFNVGLSEAFTDDFSAGIWVFTADNSLFVSELIGQGTSWHSSTGWNLMMGNDGLFWAHSDTDVIKADETFEEDAWYLVGITVEAGLMTMYVNGVGQADTQSAAITGSTAAWLGNDGYSAGGGLHGCAQPLSWGFITTEPIDPAGWAALFLAGESPGAITAGYVWTADGEGAAGWQPSMIEVEF